MSPRIAAVPAILCLLAPLHLHELVRISRLAGAADPPLIGNTWRTASQALIELAD